MKIAVVKLANAARLGQGPPTRVNVVSKVGNSEERAGLRNIATSPFGATKDFYRETISFLSVSFGQY